MENRGQGEPVQFSLPSLREFMDGVRDIDRSLKRKCSEHDRASNPQTQTHGNFKGYHTVAAVDFVGPNQARHDMLFQLNAKEGPQQSQLVQSKTMFPLSEFAPQILPVPNRLKKRGEVTSQSTTPYLSQSPLKVGYISIRMSNLRLMLV